MLTRKCDYVVDQKIVETGEKFKCEGLVDMKAKNGKVGDVTNEKHNGYMLDRQYTIYNEQVDYGLQYLIDRDIYSCSWMQIEGSEVEAKTTYCDIELNAINWSNTHKQIDRDDVAPWHVLSYDIESVPHPRGNGKYDFPSAKLDPVCTIGAVVQINESVKKYVWIHSPNGDPLEKLTPIAEPTDEYNSDDVKVFHFDDELEMLDSFNKFIIEQDIDIIEGYNTALFDHPYLFDRYHVLNNGGYPSWGRLIGVESSIKEKVFESKQAGKNITKTLYCPGRIDHDGYQVMKKNHNLNSYKLDEVAKTFLGTQKYPMDYNEIHPKYQTKEGRDELAVYCVKDAWLTRKIMHKLSKLFVSFQLACVTGIPINDVLNRGQGIRTISLMLRYSKKRTPAYFIPRRETKRTWARRNELTNELRVKIVEDETFEGFQGAVVLDPKPKFYKDAIATLDFASLYPSVMQCMNMSYETIVSRQKMLDMGWTEGKEVRTVPDYYWKDGRMQTKIDYDTNIIFATKETRVGILPEILDSLLSERRAVKKIMKKHHPDTVQYKIANGRQLGLKVCANSIYGFTGASVGFLPDKRIAESVTKYGRGLTLKTQDLIENHPVWGKEHGVTCVYGDSVSGNTPLLIKTGHHIEIVRIKDLTLENPIYTWTENGWTRVQNIIKHELATHKKMLRITTHTGIVDCTNDHSLVTSTGEAISPDDLEIGTELMHSFPTEYVGMDCTFEFCVRRTFVYKGKDYESGKEAARANGLKQQPASGIWKDVCRKISVDTNIARLFGMFMGDGSCGIYGKGQKEKSTWAINNADLSLLIKYQQIASHIFPEMTFKIHDTIKSSGVYKLAACCKQHGPVKKFCIIWRSLFYNSDKEKVVPGIILNSHPDVRCSFLCGLHDADGTKNIKHYEISQKGQQSCEGIYYLLKSLGHTVVVDGRLDKPNVFRLRTRTKMRKSLNAVKKIIEIPYEKFVYDLTTENHHFHAGIGNMIVHNTDSVFCHLPRSLCDGKTPEETVARAEEIGREMGEYVDAHFLRPVELEFEKVYLPFMLLKKKRYCGKKFEEGHVKIDMKGLECVRRDFCPLLVKTQKEMLSILMNTMDVPKACKVVSDAIRDLALGKIPLELLTMSKKLSRSPHEYKSMAAHVNLAMRINEERGEQHGFVAGDRVPYVIAKGKSFKMSENAVLPEEITSGKYIVDTDYYKEKQMIPPLTRILEKLCDNPKTLFICNALKKPVVTGVFAAWAKKRKPKELEPERRKITKKSKKVTLYNFF